VRSALILALAAGAAALIPTPPGFVEQWYSRGVFPIIQRTLTPVSSAVPFALLDAALLFGLAAWVVFVWRRWRGQGALRGLRALAVSVLAVVSAAYLLFLIVWGLNYRRVPLESRLAYDASRVTADATFRLAEEAVARVNALELRKFENQEEGRAAREQAFANVQVHLGATRVSVPANAKRSVVAWYLRLAGIDGMINPFFLEIVLNPDVLPVEQPFTLAHEWAHLAGYANESEANFVAWLTCVSADPGAEYSGWLEAYRYAVAVLPREQRRDLQRRLSPDVIADLRAIDERLGRADPGVRHFARDVYDSYLRAQGVEEGIASYSAMLRLMVGTTFDNGWVPRVAGR
jgi:hypothetical protein